MSSRTEVPIEFGGSDRKGPRERSAEIARETQLPVDWGAGLIPAHCHSFSTGWSAIGIERLGPLSVLLPSLSHSSPIGKL